jgi:hypothetical protein
MNKLMPVLLIVSLIALAFIPIACSKESAPVDYSSYSLQKVTFSYPTEWINGTAELEQSMAQDDPNYSTYMRAAGWYNPSNSAALFAISIDLQKSGMPKNYNMTESDKESIVASETGYMTAAMEQPTLMNQGQTTVSGQWAWQTEFSGKIEGVAAKGYDLTVISNDTVFVLVYASQNNVWSSLKEVYDMVKSSIVLY